MEMNPTIEVRPIGRVESPLTDRHAAPRQPDEDAPPAWLIFDPSVADGLRDMRPGTEIFLFTWLDRANREVLRVHPRRDYSRPAQGVFTTRSPDRPNPIGLHRVEVKVVTHLRVQVDHLEVLDGTPIIDVKPVLTRDRDTR